MYVHEPGFPARIGGTLRHKTSPRRSFAALLLIVLCGSVGLAGWIPLGFSMATVFLFAGPHNWMEFRYFLTRMPARWGSLRAFFSVGVAGTVLLGAGFMVMPTLALRLAWTQDTWIVVSASWHSLLLLWIASLIALKRPSLHQDRTQRSIAAFAVVSLLIAFVWMVPQAWDLMLVYLHPVIALVYLDRELGRRRPELRGTYRRSLLYLPLLLGLLFWRLRSAGPLVGDDMLTLRILRHAGADLLTGISPHFLVAAHAFLEVLHYAVWVVAIPLLTFHDKPWRIQQVPVYRRRSEVIRTAIVGALLLGAIAVLVLWGGFIANYPVTRNVYFTVAILHVLAEVPFLIQLSVRRGA